jgi:hypothetical protein
MRPFLGHDRGIDGLAVPELILHLEGAGRQHVGEDQLEPRLAQVAALLLVVEDPLEVLQLARRR